MQEIITRIVDLPPKIKGMVVKDHEDDYNIYLNQNLSIEEQQQAYLHETAHIDLDHFHTQKTIDQIEQETHTKRKEKNNERQRTIKTIP